MIVQFVETHGDYAKSGVPESAWEAAKASAWMASDRAQ